MARDIICEVENAVTGSTYRPVSRAVEYVVAYAVRSAVGDDAWYKVWFKDVTAPTSVQDKVAWSDLNRYEIFDQVRDSDG